MNNHTYISITDFGIYAEHNDEKYHIKKSNDPLLYDSIIDFINNNSCSTPTSIVDFIREQFNKINEEDTNIFTKPTNIINEIVLPDGYIIDGETLKYNGMTISTTFGRRIIYSDKQNRKNIDKFLIKLSTVDSRLVFESICDFIESNPSIMIDEDGDIIFWKYIDKHFRAVHRNPDGSHNLHIKGVPITMPRHEVTVDRNQTCSQGLHVCAKEYLDTTSPEYIICKCKVDVHDIVSVPYDYKNTKVRVCKYIPIEFYDIDGNIVEFCRQKEEDANNIDEACLKDSDNNLNTNQLINNVVQYITTRNKNYNITLRDIQLYVKGFRRKRIKDIYSFFVNIPNKFKLIIPHNIRNSDGSLKSYCSIQVALSTNS